MALHLNVDGGPPVRIRPTDRFKVHYDEDLAKSIEEIVGQGRVRPVEPKPAA